MSLIVENGTNVLNSESYASVAEALAYHAARGNTNWATITLAQQEQALRRATDFMEQVYSQNWKGRLFTSSQSLSWPRYGVWANHYLIESNAVPRIVKNACIELALKAASGDLAPDLAQRVVREKIGPIEVEYDKNSPQYTAYRAITNMLSPYLNSVGGVFRKVVRT